jgi:hypothetical protein
MTSPAVFRIGTLWLVALFFGCSNASSSGDQCVLGEQRCIDGTTLELCAPANPDAVDPGPPVWLQRPCRPASLSCVTLANGANGGAMCVDPKSFDARCGSAKESSYCRADGYVVQCWFGYQTGVVACSGTCIEPSPGLATCLEDGGYQD